MKTNSRMIVLLMTMVSTNIAYAQTNLLPNGDFNSTLGVSGWTAGGLGSMGFSTLDADILGGGSMILSALDADNPETATSQCFAVTPGSQYIFGGKYEPIQLIGASSGASFQCHSYTDRYCKLGLVDLGSTGDESIESDNSFFYFESVQGVLGDAQSANCTVNGYGSFDGLGSDQPSPVRVDDLFFYSTPNANAAPLLGGYLSGSWYDPTQSGQGFQLEFTGQGNTLLATWYTYSPNGSGTQWVYGQGTYDPTQNSVTIPAVLTSGASFPPNFVAGNVKKTPWGNLTFTFTDCDHATMNWSSTVSGYGSGTQQLQRLTSIAGLSCPQ